ncbi:MAG: DNA-3-methyladenine glycosylase [Flavobacteriales bacterium]|nr:DNA-3-methyladenine glycosylase [Flavobacteriales bacterium]
MVKLSTSYYVSRNAAKAAQELLGRALVTNINGVRTAGLITETEAYMGVQDRASHAYGGRRTGRNEVMYAAGGVAYVYLCYGIHHLFNVVVLDKDVPHAVLVRAIHPIEGQGTMLARRGVKKLTTGGPGTLTQALGIRTAHNGEDLTGQLIWIEDVGVKVPKKHIIIGPRIGVDYAGEDALLPYRFRIAPSHLL